MASPRTVATAMRASRPALMAALLAVALPWVATAEEAAPPDLACVPAPVIDGDFADPSVLYDPAAGGEAFAYATNVMSPGGGTVINVPVSHSTDPQLAHWSAVTEALPRLPAWAQPGFTWAPAVVHRPGGPYRLYFTARYGFSERQCVGVAVSQTPAGPFTPTDEVKPLVCPIGEGGAIDPSVFRDDDGAEYLLWKTDTNCCGGVPAIYIQQLAPDGLALVGPHVQDAPWLLPDAAILIRRDQAWEGLVVEAPILVKRRGRYHLFYSAGAFATPDYAVGYASAPALLGPYRKAPAPILSAATVHLPGPGGEDVFTGPDGGDWIAFHAWRQGASQPYRALFMGRIRWDLAGPTVVTACSEVGPAPPPPPPPPG